MDELNEIIKQDQIEYILENFEEEEQLRELLEHAFMRLAEIWELPEP